MKRDKRIKEAFQILMDVAQDSSIDPSQWTDDAQEILRIMLSSGAAIVEHMPEDVESFDLAAQVMVWELFLRCQR